MSDSPDSRIEVRYFVSYSHDDSRAYLARLAELEAQAKSERKGAWRFATFE